MGTISHTRRSVLAGLAASPLAALPALASPSDAQLRLDHHLEGLKQAVRDLAQTSVYFYEGRDASGKLNSLLIAQGSIPK